MYSDYFLYDLLRGAYETYNGTQFDLETSLNGSFGQW